MRREPALGGTLLCAFFLSLALSSGAVLSVATAFALPVSVRWTLAVLALLSAVFSGLFCLRKSALFLSLLWCALALLLFFLRRPFLLGLSRILAELTAIYHSAYPLFPRIGTPDPAAGPAEITGCLLLPGTIVSFLTARAVMRRRSAALPLLGGGLLLALCFVVLNTPPALPPLLACMVSGGLLALTQSVRRRSSASGAVLTAALLLPVLALSWVLTLLCPPSDYIRAETPDQLQERLLRWSAELPQLISSPGRAPAWVSASASDRTGQLRLSNLGPLRRTGARMLEVRPETGGVLYLRGMSLDTYDGISWSASAFSADAQPPEDTYFGSPLQADSYDLFYEGEAQLLQIRSHSRDAVFYTAYMPAALPESAAPIGSRFVRNPEGARSYELLYCPSAQIVSSLSAQQYEFAAFSQADAALFSRLISFSVLSLLPGLSQEEEALYTSLPDETRSGLAEYAARNGILPKVTISADGFLDMSRYNCIIADAVASHVRDSAVYDPETPAPPEGSDFVLWFLQESDRGYCVHFASAAVALLRYYNIPARIVTGYVTEAEGGRWNTVTDRQAHAWVEFFTQDLGWMPLEVTPPGGSSNVPNATSPSFSIPDESLGSTSAPSAPILPATSETDASTVPSDAVRPSDGHKKRPSAEWIIISAFVVAALLILLRRSLLRNLRRKRQASGNPNRRALALWREMTLAAGYLNRRIPPELQELVLRARFSQHELTEQELSSLSLWLDSARRALEKKPWYSRLWYRFGPGLL